MSSFKREENGEISIEISTQESQVLISLTEQLLELLAQGDSLAQAQDPLMHIVGISDSDALPEDPVLRRLFPDAYEDSTSSSEFRRYTDLKIQYFVGYFLMPMKIQLHLVNFAAIPNMGSVKKRKHMPELFMKL